MADEATIKEEPAGFVHQSLHRNKKQIMSDRAEDLADDLETASRRKCEDLMRRLKKLQRDRRAMYDFSPHNTQSLVLVAEVNGEDIADKDMAISLEIRDVQIQYDIQVERYKELYGKTFNPAS